jgi:hypothetical protein
LGDCFSQPYLSGPGFFYEIAGNLHRFDRSDGCVDNRNKKGEAEALALPLLRLEL